MQGYSLPWDKIFVVPIMYVHEFDKNDFTKFCPRLKEKVSKPLHCDKMNVSLTFALINHDVAARINYYIAENHKSIAWFIDIIPRWFKFNDESHSL